MLKHYTFRVTTLTQLSLRVRSTGIACATGIQCECRTVRDRFSGSRGIEGADGCSQSAV